MTAEDYNKMTNEERCVQLNEIMNTRGYLIIASNGDYKIDDIIPDFTTGNNNLLIQQPLKVIAITDLEDIKVQWRMLGFEEWQMNIGPLTNFYRCITD